MGFCIIVYYMYTYCRQFNVRSNNIYEKKIRLTSVRVFDPVEGSVT